MGHTNISNKEWYTIMEQLGKSRVIARSDGSVKDGVGGHSFCLLDNNFTRFFGYAQTVGHKRAMISVRAEHGDALGILLLVYAMHIF